MNIIIGILLLLARLLGMPHEVFEDGSGYIDVVPPTEVRWCGASWGAFDSPGDGFAIGCWEWEVELNPVA